MGWRHISVAVGRLALGGIWSQVGGQMQQAKVLGLLGFYIVDSYIQVGHWLRLVGYIQHIKVGHWLRLVGYASTSLGSKV